MKNKNIFTINLIASTVILLIVYSLQYVLGMQPCEMCVKERYPYFALILLSLIFLVFIRTSDSNQVKFGNIIKYLSLLVIFVALIYSFIHVGMERGFIEGFSGCSASLSNIDNAESLLLALEMAPLIRCDDPVLLFNFISIAESNFAALALLLFINIYLVSYKK